MCCAAPLRLSTMLASAGAAVWRIFTQPVQNIKTMMQVRDQPLLSVVSADDL
jgi:hypothetical protein